MLSKMKALPKLAAALAVAAALTFGATEALAEPDCTPLPPHSCAGERFPHVFCTNLCIENNYYGGECLLALDCCLCLEK